MSSNEEQIKDKIIQWGRQNWAEYADNFEVIKVLYAEAVKPKLIKDIFDGASVELMVLVLKQTMSRKINLCKSCFKKKCDCGLQQYIEGTSRSYMVGDKSGVDPVEINIAPWKDFDVQSGKVYRVVGKVKAYETKAGKKGRRVDVEGMEEVKQDTKKAVDVAKDIMRINDNKMSRSRFTDLMTKEGFGTAIEEVIKELGVQDVNGVLVWEEKK